MGRWLENVPVEEIRKILNFIASGQSDWPKWIIRVVSLYLHPNKALPNELIPVALRALQNRVSNDMELDWNRGQVAIGIAKADLDQTFKLLASDIRAIANADRWEREHMLNLFQSHDSHDFLTFLCVNHPERTCRELLALQEPLSKIDRIIFPFDLEKNLSLLIQMASESEANALFFSKAIFGVQKGFFHFAYALMDAFPKCNDIHLALASTAIYQTENGVTGDYTQCLSTIESEIANSKTPQHHIAWLDKLKQKIKQIPPRFTFYEKDRDDKDITLGWN